jgi:hypothetical protein
MTLKTSIGKPMPNRSYKKPQGLHRDHRTFVIIAEGQREDEYFQYFNGKSTRFRVVFAERNNNASAPNHFLNRLEQLKESEIWIPRQQDVVWFVLDIDRWKRAEIDVLINFCKNEETLNIAISNPCFEVWLLYHILNNLDGIDTNFKNELHVRTQGTGYNPNDFCPLIENAIINAKQKDSNSNNPFPNIKETKVYLLAEQLLEKLGKNWLADMER